MSKSAKEIVAEARNKRGGAPEMPGTAAPLSVEPPSMETIPEALRPFVSAILPFVQPTVRPEQLRALVDDAVLRLMPRPASVVVKKEGQPERKIDLVHRQLGELIEEIDLQPYSKRGPYLVGPAGGAKSTAAMQAADALGLNCFLMSLGPQTSKGDLVGFVDAHGKPVRTPLYWAFAEGGLICFDEADAANGGVFTILNALLSQPSYLFPGDLEPTPRHENFRYMAAGNTYGMGANLIYVGRQQQDGASLDRFTQMVWGYDPELEKALAIRAATSVPGGVDAAAGLAIKWAARVHALRAAAEKAGVRIIISPRAVISGAAKLAKGRSWEETENREVWRDGGISRDDRERVLSHV